MTDPDELVREITAASRSGMPSNAARFREIGADIFSSPAPVDILGALFRQLLGSSMQDLLLHNLPHLKNLSKADYQRLFTLLEGSPVAIYDLTYFLVHYARVRGPMLREISGDTKEFRDIAEHQMENAILGDGLAPEGYSIAVPSGAIQYDPIESITRWWGIPAAELMAFREHLQTMLS